jgi:hypothetical protein
MLGTVIHLIWDIAKSKESKLLKYVDVNPSMQVVQIQRQHHLN